MSVIPEASFLFLIKREFKAWSQSFSGTTNKNFFTFEAGGQVVGSNLPKSTEYSQDNVTIQSLHGLFFVFLAIVGKLLLHIHHWNI